jgi:hypothetical protein
MLIGRRKDIFYEHIVMYILHTLKTHNKGSLDTNLQFFLAAFVQMMVVCMVHTLCSTSGLFRRLGVIHHHLQSA